MRIFGRYGFAVIFLCAYLSTAAQEKKALINSGELLEQGSKLHDAGKYKEAIALYKKISRSDTNYYRALHELSLSNYMDSNFEVSRKYAELGVELFPSKANQLYNLLANDLDELGQKEEALMYYDKIIEANPNDYLAWFNKGITLYNQKRHPEAKACLQKTILIYPYYSSAHYYLGVINVEEGDLISALMSFTTNLIINPENRYVGNAINYLNNIAVVKDEILKKAETKKPSQDDNFELQQEILLSKISFDKKYKLLTEVEDPITKQLQVVFEKLSYDNSDKGFWMQYYVPIYQQIFSERKYNVFVNYIFSGLNIKEVQTYNKKNKKEIDEFVKYVVKYFDEIKETQTSNAQERKNMKIRYIFSNGAVSGKGEWKQNGKEEVLIGPWEFYHPNGQLKSKGLLNENQGKEGEWFFYNDDGQVNERSVYANGKANGKSVSWFDNGLIFSESIYKNDELNGERRQYFYNGMLRLIENYADGKKTGIIKAFTVTGDPYYTANYNNDKLEGELKYFHPNGKVSVISHYVNGEATGAYQKFNEAGVLVMEGNYANDKATGRWKNYFASSKLEKEYYYNNGDLEGEYKEYFENGTLSQKLFYQKGKLEGKEEDYDEDGILYCDSYYEKGRIKEVNFYDKTKKLISNATTRKGAGNLVFYDAEGNKNSEGYFTKDGLRDGKTTYYFRDGKIKTIANFKEGLLEGERTVYYRDGNISEKVNYSNDEENGYYKSQFENGKPKYEGWYVEGSKQGEHVEYNSLGNILKKKYYRNNDEDGFAEFYNANGKIDYEQRFDNGWIKHITQFDTSGKIIASISLPKGNGGFAFKHFNGRDYIKGTYSNYYLHGKYEVLFFDGSKSGDQYFRYGYNDSLYRQYFYGGQLRTEGKFVKGSKEGTWKYFYSNGKIFSTEEYKDGEQNGQEEIYEEDGRLIKEMTYKNGELNGPCKMYGENKQLALIFNYTNGKLRSYTYEGKDGKLVEPIALKSETGMVTGFYPNGNKSAEINFEEGVINGVRKLFFSNGNVYMEGNRISGSDDGAKKIFSTNGQLVGDENYYYGNLHGVNKYYYENGNLKSEENWYNGEQNGISKYYDESGKLKQTRLYYYGVLQSVQ